MAVITTNLTCDLQHPVKVQYLDGNLFSQDNQANIINVAVFNDGEPEDISGDVSANVIRADGMIVPGSTTVSVVLLYTVATTAAMVVITPEVVSLITMDTTPGT